MQTAIIYTRVSTDEQAEKGYSLADQKQRLEKHCESKGLEIVKHFEDDGYSAKNFNRPHFNNLLDFVKKNKGLVKKLLVVKWDRFSRNMELSMSMITQLMKAGVEVEAIEQPLDESIPENLLMKAFYLAAPQVENARRSLNTSNGMRRALREGRYCSTAPYGFKNARDSQNKPILIHSELAPIIKKAFTEIATGNFQIEVLRKQLVKEGLNVSRSNFYTLLRNPIYCGKIRIKAFRNEPEEIVNGIHEPIVSEELFIDVQNVLDGKKRTKTKYSVVNESFPLRGFLICPRCGKALTGSASKGNGGKYSYYHCTKGCNERHINEALHTDFNKWLKSITLKPEMAALYLAVMEDIFKANEGDRDKEIKELQTKIEANTALLEKSAIKLAKEEIDKFVYNTVRSTVIKENRAYEVKISELKGTESGFKEYYRYGFSLLGNMSHYYNEANMEGKQKMIGLIFPEKLKYSDKTFQTIEPNDILGLMCNGGKAFGVFKKGQSNKNATLSYEVPEKGFEPSQTFVRCDLNTVCLPISPLGQCEFVKLKSL